VNGSAWVIVAVILLAVGVGAGVPVLVQLRATLRAAERFFETTGPRAGRCLEEVTVAASRANEASRDSGRLASTLVSAAVPAFLAALDAIRGRSQAVSNNNEDARGERAEEEAEVAS